MVVAAALVFATNIEYSWEIAVMCTKVQEEHGQRGKGLCREKEKGLQGRA